MKNIFRIVIPRKTEEFLILTGLILKKHTADAELSLLKTIDMDKVQYLHETSLIKHNKAEELNRNKLKANEQKNLLLGLALQQKSYTPDSVLYFVTSIRDYLMGVYKGREKQLGDWGFAVDESKSKKNKIAIPRNPDKLIQLANEILQKHVKDGSDSILRDFNMFRFTELHNEAKEMNTLAKQLEKDKEKTYQERNHSIGFGNGDRSIKPDSLLYYVASIRDMLKGHFKGIEQKLGDWGFEVNTSPNRAMKAQVTVAKISGKVITELSREPIEGIKLHFHSHSGSFQAVTTTDGTYNLDIKSTEKGSVIIIINQLGFESYTTQKIITPGEEYVFDFVLISM